MGGDGVGVKRTVAVAHGWAVKGLVWRRTEAKDGWGGDGRLGVGRTLGVAKGVFGYKFVAASHRYLCVVLCC